MANILITPDVIAKISAVALKNELVMGELVYRDTEASFKEAKVGDKVRIKRPINYEVTDGATLVVQDTIEGTVEVELDKRRHVGMEFSSKELTLSVEEFTERHIKPAVRAIAHKIDSDVHSLYKQVYYWRGTPGQKIDSWDDLAKGPEWLDTLGVPSGRNAVLSPSDYWSLAGSIVALQAEVGDANRSALMEAKLRKMAGIDIYQTAQVMTHTVGAHAGTPLVNGANQNVAYDASTSGTTARTKWRQTLNTDGWNGSGTLRAGDVFTIAGVYAVNPANQQALPQQTANLQQFVILEDVTLPNNPATNVALTISPPIITSGPYRTVSAAPADNAAITYVGTANTGYPQNMVFHRNAFALTVVPLEMPVDGTLASRSTHDGFSVRVVAAYDEVNDKNIYRLDVLYGVTCLDPRLATRLSGTS